jgi:hypothetical protein
VFAITRTDAIRARSCALSLSLYYCCVPPSLLYRILYSVYNSDNMLARTIETSKNKTTIIRHKSRRMQPIHRGTPRCIVPDGKDLGAGDTLYGVQYYYVHDVCIPANNRRPVPRVSWLGPRVRKTRLSNRITGGRTHSREPAAEGRG